MGEQPLTLKIENQTWLGHAEEDLCSHGQIYLNVNGTILTQAGLDEEWGISESALALLRTLDNGVHTDQEGLILHGCGTILMINCPISINWTVTPVNDHVILSDFVKIRTTDPETGRVDYPGLEITLKKTEYKQHIIQFALQAKKFFDCSKEKQFADTADQAMYQEFWKEYNQRLQQHLSSPDN